MDRWVWFSKINTHSPDLRLLSFPRTQDVSDSSAFPTSEADSASAVVIVFLVSQSCGYMTGAQK